MIAYFVYRYKKAIGYINTFVLFITLIFATLISVLHRWFEGSLEVPKFLMQFLTSSVIILISSQIFNTIFPKYTKVLLRFYSISRNDVILKRLEEIGYWHAYNKVDCSTKCRERGSYIETVCLYLEVRELVNLIRSVDPEVFIFISPIKEVWGRFNTERIE